MRESLLLPAWEHPTPPRRRLGSGCWAARISDLRALVESVLPANEEVPHTEPVILAVKKRKVLPAFSKELVMRHKLNTRNNNPQGKQT